MECFIKYKWSQSFVSAKAKKGRKNIYSLCEFGQREKGKWRLYAKFELRIHILFFFLFYGSLFSLHPYPQLHLFLSQIRFFFYFSAAVFSCSTNNLFLCMISVLPWIEKDEFLFMMYFFFELLFMLGFKCIIYGI